MTRFKFAVCVASLLGLTAIANQSLAQFSGVREADVEPVASIDPVDEPAQGPDTDKSNPPPAIGGNQDQLPVAKLASPPQEGPGPQVLRLLAAPSKAGHRAKTVTRYIHEQILVPIPTEELEEAKEFEGAVKALKDAKNDDEKAQATTAIQQLLEKQYQRDLKRREEELAPIEERVKSLRQQLDKRKSSMNEIISLRFKTIVNNAEGLGFPDDDGLFGTSGSTNDLQRPARAQLNRSSQKTRKELNDAESESQGNAQQLNENIANPPPTKTRTAKPRSSSKGKVTKPPADSDDNHS